MMPQFFISGLLIPLTRQLSGVCENGSIVILASHYYSCHSYSMHLRHLFVHRCSYYGFAINRFSVGKCIHTHAHTHTHTQSKAYTAVVWNIAIGAQ